MPLTGWCARTCTVLVRCLRHNSAASLVTLDNIEMPVWLVRIGCGIHGEHCDSFKVFWLSVVAD
jgi:hypothetical protein